MTDTSESRGRGPRLTPRRAGELLAHFAFFRGEPRSAVAVALGYAESVVAEVESLKSSLSAALIREELAELHELARANEIVARRLRATRPKLGSVKPDPQLEPVAITPVVTRPPPMEALRASPAEPALAPPNEPAAAQVVPSYLQAVPAPCPPAAPEAILPRLVNSNRGIAVGVVIATPAASGAAAEPAGLNVPRFATGTMAPSLPGSAPLPFITPAPPAKRPSESAPSKPPLDWPLESWARFTVDLANAPRDTVLRTYGVSEADVSVLEGHWRPRLEDPATRQRLRALMDHYRAGRYGGPR